MVSLLGVNFCSFINLNFIHTENNNEENRAEGQGDVVGAPADEAGQEVQVPDLFEDGIVISTKILTCISLAS